MELSGILVIDKPAGPTSFDVVHALRRALKVKKVGHTGTLDPAATGVLPICLGDATRVAGYLTEGDKVYEARVRLGSTTDTQDAAGKVIATRDWSGLRAEQVEAALQRFRGTFAQTPPMYSAVKVDGVRLYELAREGIEVERKPRTITIRSLQVTRLELPDIDLRVECSKGTYIRTLAADLGEVLGCGAHLAALRRVRSGPFTIDEAVPLASLSGDSRDVVERVRPRLAPIERGFESWATYDVVGSPLQQNVFHGVAIPVQPGQEAWPEGERIRVLGEGGRLLALAERKGPWVKYLRVLVTRA